ncbi:hypothetical protein NP493_1114g00054 [Ridgeia piscesae]|uniref:Uncharacterized protein n=1 Tax=Ridgeia piscesae TaxID=27915 RepID=A0AAD9KHS2_RIDPI|nr:hypothetical protein NP493_1114g00054 [Ridgeia piscesae]
MYRDPLAGPNAYHDLLQEQRRQQNETVDALDYEEAEKIEKITQEQNEKLAQDMKNTEEEFQKKLLLKGTAL